MTKAESRLFHRAHRFYNLVAEGEMIGLSKKEEAEYKRLKPMVNPKM